MDTELDIVDFASSDPKSRLGPDAKKIGLLSRLLAGLWWSTLAVLACVILFGIYALIGGLKASVSQLSIVSGIFSWVTIIIAITVFLIVQSQLRKILQTLAAGDPFVPKNADRLRVIWGVVAIAEFLRLIGEAFIVPLFQKTTADISVSIRAEVWFLVLALAVFSEVLREGARMRQEQKLTV